MSDRTKISENPTRETERPTGSDNKKDTILQLQDVSVIFDMDRGRSNVLTGVSFTVYEGEVLGIVGESGSGKSMLASVLLDAVDQSGLTTGNVLYNDQNGRTVDILSTTEEELNRIRWEEISMVFQGALDSFNPTLSVGEHFDETIRAHGGNVQERMTYAEELLEEFHLDPERTLDAHPHELSGGMKQRALIALSLVLEPEILVMDEPTSSLDLLMQRSIIQLIEKIQEKYGLTVVFISHNIPLVSGITDRLGVLYGFEIIEYGSTDDVITNPTHPYTRGLMRSIPTSRASIEGTEPIPGDSPDPVDIPSGCSYHTRCPLADDRCRQTDPELQPTTSPDHQSACFYWEESLAEVPYSLDSQGTTDE